MGIGMRPHVQPEGKHAVRDRSDTATGIARCVTFDYMLVYHGNDRD